MIPGKFINIVAMLAAACVGAYAQTLSFQQVKELAADGPHTFAQDTFIEAYSCINGGWGNIAQNKVRYHSSTNGVENTHTAYIQNADATHGLCIKGKSTKLYKTLKMGDRLVLNLKGTTVVREESGAYTIRWVELDNLMEKEQKGMTALRNKVKAISELDDQDLCTFVTVKDCEFVFKDGAYINIYEVYGQKNKGNAECKPNGIMDGWLSLLTDSSGNTLYTAVNTGVNWRRNSEGVPQGSGNVSGVLTKDRFERYSSHTPGYQIRCANNNFFRFGMPSAYKTLAIWNWNDGGNDFKTTDGAKRNPGESGILADEGKGVLYCTPTGSITRGWDYNNPRIDTKDDYSSKGQKGRWEKGALRMGIPACRWWDWEKNEGKGIRVEFSTEGIQSRTMYFAFTFGGGNLDPATSAFFPVYWKVQYSVDCGKSWNDAGGEITCRSTPWWYGRGIKGQTWYTSYEAGLGFTDHLVVLPAECMDREKVMVRVIPSRRNAASNSVTQPDNYALRPNLQTQGFVSFGTVAIRYE